MCYQWDAWLCCFSDQNFVCCWLNHPQQRQLLRNMQVGTWKEHFGQHYLPSMRACNVGRKAFVTSTFPFCAVIGVALWIGTYMFWLAAADAMNRDRRVAGGSAVGCGGKTCWFALDGMQWWMLRLAILVASLEWGFVWVAFLSSATAVWNMDTTAGWNQAPSVSINISCLQ